MPPSSMLFKGRCSLCLFECKLYNSTQSSTMLSLIKLASLWLEPRHWHKAFASTNTSRKHWMKYFWVNWNMVTLEASTLEHNYCWLWDCNLLLRWQQLILNSIPKSNFIGQRWYLILYVQNSCSSSREIIWNEPP